MAVKYEKVRDWVLALPGGEEVMVQEWGHPTLRVNNKMFASGVPGETAMTVKCTKQEQEALLGAAPEVYSLAPYVAGSAGYRSICPRWIPTSCGSSSSKRGGARRPRNL